MKITNIPSSIVPTIDSSGVQQPTRVDSMRTLRMKTNATPLPIDMQIPQQLPVEANNRETAPTVEATQPLSPQLALLARQRRALQAKEREILMREKALSEKSAQSSSIELARLKSDPIGVMLENGITYDDLTQAILKGQNNTEVYALKAKIQELEQGIDKKFEDQNVLARKQALADMKREAERLMHGSDQFDLVKETRSIPHVMSLIERTFDSTGEILDITEAMQLVENELFKDYQKIAGLKKLQQLQGPGVSQVQAPQAPRPQGMRTLTNRDTAQVPLSARQRALAAFRGQLKR